MVLHIVVNHTIIILIDHIAVIQNFDNPMVVLNNFLGNFNFLPFFFFGKFNFLRVDDFIFFIYIF